MVSRFILEKILKYIDDQIHNKISLKELAAIAGYSPFYFSRLFSEIMGMSLTSYIRLRKLQHAAASLLESRKILEVALLYGFDSHEGFTRAFVQLFGTTPSKARKYLNAYRVPEYIVPDFEWRYLMEAQNDNQLQDNLHQMIFEFLKQSLEEVCMGYCTDIRIILFQGGEISIQDKGRGLPLTRNMCSDKVLLDKILSGQPITRFEYSQMEDFSDIGLQTANSLCESLQVTVYRENTMFRQDYVRGIAQHELIVQDIVHESGMEIILKPDKEIFGELYFSEELIENWIQEHMKQHHDLVKIVDQRV